MTNKKIASEIAIGTILLLAIAVGGIFYWQNQKSIQQPEQRACTMEAKLCDDGSYVSRIGPNCEFEACPIQTDCVSAGTVADEYSFGKYIGPKNCCDGLKKIDYLNYKDGQCGHYFDTFTICSDCGNGSCEEWENPCNCSQDCKEGNVQVANPASTYCVENGGESEIRTAEDGSQTGYCKFNDGSECEEWAYFRKECTKGNLNSMINTSDWQTYKNIKYGYELKYPQDWRIANSENGINFQSAEVAKWEIENKNNCKEGINCHSELPPFDLMLTYLPKQEFEKQLGTNNNMNEDGTISSNSISEEKVSINGINYIKYGIFGDMIGSDNYRTEKLNRIYNFEIIGKEEIPKKIMESFKFTK